MKVSELNFLVERAKEIGYKQAYLWDSIEDNISVLLIPYIDRELENLNNWLIEQNNKS